MFCALLIVAVPDDLLIVTFLNVVNAEPPMVWAPVPLNVTVVAFPDRLTATLLVQLPATLKLTALLSKGGSTSIRTSKNCVGPRVLGKVLPLPAVTNSTVPPVELNVPLLLKS